MPDHRSDPAEPEPSCAKPWRPLQPLSGGAALSLPCTRRSAPLRASHPAQSTSQFSPRPSPPSLSWAWACPSASRPAGLSDTTRTT